MQANGGTSEASTAVIGNGNDQLPDISGATNAAQSSQVRPLYQQSRSPTPPGQQQQQQPHQHQSQHPQHHQHLPYHQQTLAGSMTGSGVGSGQIEQNAHHHAQQSGSYGRQRHGQSYHNQQQQQHMQHYHHQNKYNNPRGDSGFNVSRGGPPSGYVGVDAFMPSHHGGPHGNLYSRQDGHHQQHHQPHHHPSRSGLGGAGGASNQNHNSSYPSANASNAIMSGSSSLLPQGTVMMVYGLHPERVNCERLFNLFCLYGNVVRVKFLRTKEGCAMVQMGDVLAVDRCVSSLNKMTLFGNELQISYSKQAFLHDVMQPYILPDGSPSFKDFACNKNNRFKNPELASKNRILPPSQVLHFFNAPFGITEDELLHLFKQTSGHEPVSLKIFTPKTDTTRSFSGLVTFRDPAEATEALVLCNHLSIPKAGAPHPYILRLCFSPPTYMRASQPAPNYVTPTAN